MNVFQAFASRHRVFRALAGCAGVSVASVLAAQVSARAQEQEKAPGTIEVVARIDDPAQDRTGPVRALDAGQLRAQAPVSALEALSLLPGIDAFEKGGLGGGSYLSIRGGEPNFALVLVNGVRVNDPMQSAGGGFDFSLIAPGDLAGIDVLSGPTSTVYGADALAGVVSMRLAKPDERGSVHARAGFGSGERYSLGGRIALAGEQGALLVSASTSDTGDLLSASRTERRSALLSASQSLGDAITVDLFGLYSESESEGFPEDSGGPLLAVLPLLETRDRRQVALGATLAATLSPAATLQLRAGWSRSDLQSDSPGIAAGVLDAIPPIVTDSRFERFDIAASLSGALADWADYALGGSLVHEDGASDGTLDFGVPIATAFALERTLPGIFATATLRHPAGIEVRAGLRADFPEGGRTQVTPRLGASVPLGGNGLTLTANFARGFKQPSLFALGFPLLANPDLKDELSATYDAGIAWASVDGGWNAGVTAFRSVYGNLIDFEPDLFTNVNRARVTAKGIEISASGQTGAVRLTGALTYMTTRSQDGAPLRFRPKWKGRAAIDWALSPRLNLRLDGQFTGSVIDSSIPTGFVQLEGFERLDAEIGWQALPHVRIVAAIRNITGARYFRTVGVPEPGRNVFIALRTAL